jgi:hypothetical protein
MKRNTKRAAFLPSSTLIHSPHFVGKNRTRLRAIVERPSGQLQIEEGPLSDKSSGFIRDVLLQYRLKEIEAFTHRRNQFHDRLEAARLAKQEAAVKKSQMAQLFEAKKQALKIPDVRRSRNKALLRRIRSARSHFEVMAWTTVVLSRAEMTMRKNVAGE